MNVFRKPLLIAALLLPLFCSAGNSAKIAVVDLEKVFREYYKSRIAEDLIKQQAAAYRKYIMQLQEELQQLSEAVKTARRNALNIALSQEEKNKADAEAAAKAKAFRAKEAELKLFAEERSADMRKLENSKRAEIMSDIRAELKKRAAAGGFDFVFDSSGRSMNDQPALLVYPERNDITNAVIRELNRTRTAPAKK